MTGVWRVFCLWVELPYTLMVTAIVGRQIARKNETLHLCEMFGLFNVS